MSDDDPWYLNYYSLKIICKLYNYNNYEYIKIRMSKIMKRIIDENLDYDLGLP